MSPLRRLDQDQIQASRSVRRRPPRLCLVAVAIPYPYQELIDVNAGQSRYQPEYELLDTGAFDGDRYWVTEVVYAKAGPDDLLMSIQVTNKGPDAETLHVLPTAWFRNTWSWGDDGPRPALRASGDRSVALDHPFVGATATTAPRSAPSTRPGGPA